MGEALRLALAIHRLQGGVLLVVYVDDFKMAGSMESLKKGWDLLRPGDDAIRITDPEPIAHYLGCKHVLEIIRGPDGVERKTLTVRTTCASS